jgi:hypothetical protein
LGDPSGEGSGDPWRDPSGQAQGDTEMATEWVRKVLGIALANSATVTVRGPGSASARPGPCTRPRSADALTRREYHPARQRPGVKLVRPRPPLAGQPGTARGWRAACGGSGLTPGRAGWSRGHGSGVPPSAPRPRRARALPHPLTNACDDPLRHPARPGVTIRRRRDDPLRSGSGGRA